MIRKLKLNPKSWLEINAGIHQPLLSYDLNSSHHFYNKNILAFQCTLDVIVTCKGQSLSVKQSFRYVLRHSLKTWASLKNGW